MANEATFTTLELQFIQAITDADFYENGRDSICWDFSVYDCCPFNGKKRSGVISSLVQKGFLAINEKETPTYIDKDGNKQRNPFYRKGEPESKFGTIAITEEGYAALDSLELIDEDGYLLERVNN